MSVHTAPLLRGRAVQSTGVANGTATATVAAIEGTSHIILGVEAHYDVSVTVIKAIVITQGSNVYTIRWDFNNGLFAFALPVGIKADVNQAVTATLAASGDGGTTGYVTLFVAEN